MLPETEKRDDAVIVTVEQGFTLQCPKTYFASLSWKLRILRT
jgi:hypothetical protein